jgi:hypothetical protein
MYKKKVRKGIFETNSSSCHSIILGKGDFERTGNRFDVEGGVIRIYPGEFGWGPERFSDAATKASYALTWAKQAESEECLEMLETVIMEVTGYEVEFAGSCVTYSPWGHIDHQSSEVGRELFVSEDVLENFIFNPNSILVIDNDNH